MSRAFEAGETVYLCNGAEAVYVAAADDSGHIVRPVYESEDWKAFGKPAVLFDVFAAPPVERFAAQIVEARAELERVRAETAAAREELVKTQDAKDEQEKALRRLRALPGVPAILLDAAEGRFTHAVLRDGRIVRLDGDQNHVEIKVLWRAGHTWEPTIWFADEEGALPARSEEEARALRDGMMLRRVRECQWGNLTKHVREAESVGVTVPPEALRAGWESVVKARKKELAENTAKVTVLTGIIADAESELAKVLPGDEPAGETP